MSRPSHRSQADPRRRLSVASYLSHLPEPPLPAGEDAPLWPKTIFHSTSLQEHAKGDAALHFCQ